MNGMKFGKHARTIQQSNTGKAKVHSMCFFNGQNWIKMKAEINNESDRKQGNILFNPKKSDETVFVLEIYKNEQIDGNITEDLL